MIGRIRLSAAREGLFALQQQRSETCNRSIRAGEDFAGAIDNWALAVLDQLILFR